MDKRNYLGKLFALQNSGDVTIEGSSFDKKLQNNFCQMDTKLRIHDDNWVFFLYWNTMVSYDLLQYIYYVPVWVNLNTTTYFKLTA